MKKPAPTDLEITEAIHRHYYDVYLSNRKPDGALASVIIPIDIVKVASELKLDPDIVFGLLYYHLRPKYRQQQSDGSFITLFEREAGGQRDCINFPMLDSLVASLRDESRKWLWTTIMAAAGWCCPWWRSSLGSDRNGRGADVRSAPLRPRHFDIVIRLRNCRTVPVLRNNG